MIRGVVWSNVAAHENNVWMAFKFQEYAVWVRSFRFGYLSCETVLDKQCTTTAVHVFTSPTITYKSR